MAAQIGFDSNSSESQIVYDEFMPSSSPWSPINPIGDMEDHGVLSPLSSGWDSNPSNDKDLPSLVQSLCINQPLEDDFLSSFSSSIQPTGWEWISSDEDESSSISQNSEEVTKHDYGSQICLPRAFMFYGDFHGAKIEASNQNKWLLVSLQTDEEFIHDLLNTTIAQEDVTKKLYTKFILWKIYHSSVEGEKVFSWYKLVSAPAVIVVDPITGRKMHALCGKIEPESMMEGLRQYMETSPKEELAKPTKEAIGISTTKKRFVKDDEGSGDVQISTRSSTNINGELVSEEEHKDIGATKSFEKTCYPLLPEEPKDETGCLCIVGIKLPDGRIVRRNFLGTDPIVFLWSFCSSLMDEGVNHPSSFRLATAGVLNKLLSFESSSQTFDEVSLNNSMINLIFD